MKTLVLSCNTGGGHNAAGEAICENLRKNNVDCDFVDLLSLAGPKVSRGISKTYVFITTKIPQVFRAIYKAGSCISSSRWKSPVYYANELYKDKLYHFVVKNGYDTIVMPHLFPAEALTSLRKEGKLEGITTVAVGTDYTCIPFWEETAMDYYVIPHPDLTEEFHQRGIPSEKLLPYGIPVKEAFQIQRDKKQAKKELYLDPDKPLYLIMSGSMGFGNVGKLLEAILRKHGNTRNMIVLCGSNRKLKRKLRTRFRENGNIRIVSYTKEVSKYMDACDVIFTKPGGLTTTEAAVKNIPLIHTDPIPGCETINAAFFSSRGMSVSSSNIPKQLEAADTLLQDEEKRSAMLAAQRKNIAVDTAERIFQLLQRVQAGTIQKESGVG